MIFDYPEPRLERIHGPAGYSTYESFRPWLRDEFTFRCVYCLKREMRIIDLANARDVVLYHQLTDVQDLCL